MFKIESWSEYAILIMDISPKSRRIREMISELVQTEEDYIELRKRVVYRNHLRFYLIEWMNEKQAQPA